MVSVFIKFYYYCKLLYNTTVIWGEIVIIY